MENFIKIDPKNPIAGITIGDTFKITDKVFRDIGKLYKHGENLKEITEQFDLHPKVVMVIDYFNQIYNKEETIITYRSGDHVWYYYTDKEVLTYDLLEDAPKDVLLHLLK